MLATIALHPMYDRRHLNSLPHNKPDMRAIQISVAFIRTYGIVVSLLAACGFPVPMSEVRNIFIFYFYFFETFLLCFFFSLEYSSHQI